MYAQNTWKRRKLGSETRTPEEWKRLQIVNRPYFKHIHNSYMFFKEVTQIII
jgi:O-antigen ligase